MPSQRLPGKLATPSVGAAAVCSDGGRGLPAKLLRGGFRPRTLSREYLPNRRSHMPSQRLPGKLATPSVGAAAVCSDGGRGLLARGGFHWFRPRTLSRAYLRNGSSRQPSRRLPGKLATPSVGAAAVCSDGGRGLLARGGFRARCPEPTTLSKTTLPFFILDGNFTAPDRQRSKTTLPVFILDCNFNPFPF
jgi:hypothetical protein